MTRTRSIRLVALSISFGLLLAYLFMSAQAGTAAPTVNPTRLTTDLLDHWSLDSEFIYWSDLSDQECATITRGGNAPTARSILKRRPINGGMHLTLGDVADCRYRPLASDASGVYYEFDESPQQPGSAIYRHAPNQPATAALVVNIPEANVSQVVLNSQYVYWSRGAQLYRSLKSGGSAVLVANLPAQINDFVVSGGQLIVAATSGVYFVNPACGGSPCPVDLVTSTNAAHVLDGGPGSLAGVFYMVTNSTQELRKLSCLPSGEDWVCTVGLIHDTPAGWQVAGLAATCIPTFPTFMCRGYSQFFLTEVDTDESGSQLLRVYGSGTSEEIAIGDQFIGGVYLNDGYVYWAEKGVDPGIYVLPYNAAPLERDLEATAWEVTQVVQNLENEIPLVAGKETFVTLHGRQLSGPRAMSVEAELHGRRDGVALPGSPLRATLPVRLETGGTIDRLTPDRSWLFALPPEWTAAGTLELTATVDGREAYTDMDRTNNSLQDTFSFGSEPDACLMLSPVRTHTALPSYNDPNFWPTIQRFNSLWPTAKTNVLWLGEPIEEWGICYTSKFPNLSYPCLGAYELEEGWSPTNFPPDRDRVIMQLIARHALSLLDAKSLCDLGILDPMHAVGMVHPDANTGGDGGYAWPVFHASWTQFPGHQPQTRFSSVWPHSGFTLAHELAHNYDRQHVDCPAGRPFWPDDDYPYDPCKMDDGALDDPDTYFGFDPISRQIVRPDSVGDIMSYQDHRWMSDYTYRAVRSATLLQRMERQAARNELAAAGEVVYMSGYYDPELDMGGLNYAYQLAAENLDTNRLAGMLAPSVGESGLGTLNPTVGISSTLQFFNATGALLDQKQVDLTVNDDYDGTTGVFSVVFPALEAPVARVQLVVGGSVVAASAPGMNVPQVTVLEPAAGAFLDQTIRVRWTATDPDGDPLLHTIHYSPDDGQSWLTLVTDYPGLPGTDEVTLDLTSPETVPGGTDTARIKIASSDGYHTTEVTSATFSVQQRSPVAVISEPLPETVYDAGSEVVVRGEAYDPEDGVLSGSALYWQYGFKDGVFTRDASGSPANLGGLAPGEHRLRLNASDSAGRAGHAEATVRVAPLSIPRATISPLLDGRCDDVAYDGSSRTALKPYEEQGQAAVQLLRTDTDLWACFAGLAKAGGNEPGLVRLLVDGDYDRTGSWQSGDSGFVLLENGTLQRWEGSVGGWQIPDDQAGYAAEVSAGDMVWQAEMRIPLALVELGDDRDIGLYLVHADGGSPAAWDWPNDGFYVKPDSWGQTILGELPQLDEVSPVLLTAGDGPTELVLTGRRFAAGAVALWDGVPLPTVVVSPTRLTATVAAGLLDVAGVFPVTVRNPELPNVTSEARSVVVANVRPSLTSVTPDETQAGGAAFTLSVKGSGFVPGAMVYWNGEARQTAYVSSGELQAAVRATDLAIPGVVSITVANPEPRAGVSTALPFAVTVPDEPLVWTIFMPAAVKP